MRGMKETAKSQDKTLAINVSATPILAFLYVS